MSELALVRPNLSGPVADRLREMIVDNRLQAGERINEVHLSARLGVSRTPLREALIRLEAEGALASFPRSGFFVRPLTLAEFEQIYPMRALLDPEALRLAGLPSPKRLERLADYVIAGIGMLPGTLLYVYLGSAAGQAVAAAGGAAPGRSPAQWALFGVGLAATVAVTLYVTRIARRALRDATGQ
jgi:hypothetical protein